MEPCACGIFRASAINIENVSSAVEIVLPPGVFITTMPRCVAVSTSTLSTPTPARPTTRSFGAASMTRFVTLVSDRTTSAATSPTSGSSSASASRFSRTVTLNSGCCCSRAIPFGEMGSQIITFIKQGGHCRGRRPAGQMFKGAARRYRPWRLRSRAAGGQQGSRRRLIRGLTFECRTQQPVSLEALHQVIGVSDGRGNCTENVGVGLYLRVQIARDVGEVVQRERKLFRNGDQVGIDTGESGVGIVRRQFELLIEICGKEPAAERAVKLAQLSGDFGQIRRTGARAQSERVQIRRRLRAVGQHRGQLIRQV